MIGSISKVRPCGHGHYYKYSTYKTGSDLKTACPNVAHDLNGDNDWEFSLHNMENLNSGSLFYNINLNNFKAETPKLTSVTVSIFSGGSNFCCNDCIMNWDKVTNIQNTFQYTKFKRMP